MGGDSYNYNYNYCKAAESVKMPSKSKINWSDSFTKFDAFGRPITLTYKGNPIFRTQFGAWMTVIMYLIVGIYAIQELIPVITQQVKSV
jgi:hypothetical protein